MRNEQRLSHDFIAAWADVLAAVRTGDLDKRIALERINYLIRNAKDTDIRRFLKNMRWRIRWMRVQP